MSIIYDVGVPTLEFLDAAALRDTVTAFRDAVSTHAERINRLNVYPVPDGDTGTNMARTLDAVVAELEDTPQSGAETCDAISHGSLMGARGNSGVILSQIMRGLAGTLRAALVSSAKASASQVAEALQAASVAAYEAVLKPVEGTILTVVRESAEGAKRAAGSGGRLVDVLRAAREAARSALEKTPELLSVLKDAGVVDAGGAGYLLLLDAAMHVVDGEPLPESVIDASLPVLDPSAAHAAHAGDGSIADLRYEVMYLLELDQERIDDFKTSWAQIGDSIVVVGGDGMYNCHVHTNDIGAAIESAIALDGRPRQIRVTDLLGEVAAEHDRRRSVVGLPAVDSAVVAVASGPGLAELFVQLGVQGVVTGGQTMNPSTAELLDFVERVNADQVIVLPNNKNIIPVADQVDALTEKAVVVVPTVSMPEALAALIVYDPEVDAATNSESMAAAIVGVTTGEVTRAVRATNTDAGPVEEGDWIALVRGDGVVAVASSLDEIVLALLEQLVGEGHELVTVVAGADATSAATSAIEQWVADAGLDVEVHRGDQPLYPYLVGVE